MRDLTIHYGRHAALTGASFDLRAGEIFGIIGPANSGKTSFLRALNRMDDFIPAMHVSGRAPARRRRPARLEEPLRPAAAHRRRLPPAGGPAAVGLRQRGAGAAPGRRQAAGDLDEIVEHCLTRAALWDEVKDRLGSLGSLLSGGQQQRLTIARALSQEPDLLLLDEFSIAVDPVTTMRIEDVLKELKHEVTIVLVTNLVQQARRLADRTAFFLGGECVEVGATEDLFTRQVQDPRTQEYVEGRFG